LARQHYLNISRLLGEILAQKNIVPIINENDSVAIEELMFTDNDELAGLIAAQMNADKLIILSHVKGVYTSHPDDPDSKIISLIDPKQGWPEVSAVKSKQGRGGMNSKLAVARKMSGLGISTSIAPIDLSFVITRIIEEESLGTLILPSKKKSNIKKWMAFNLGKSGSITIHQGLLKLLNENKCAMSILPVGILNCSGDFKKGDLVEIFSSERLKIGIGIARYDSNRLKEYLGQKGQPLFIHYDHLHIF
jgi:glutamate 5-kinase